MKKAILALALVVGLSVAAGLVHVTKRADGTVTTMTTTDPGGGIRP